MLDVLLLGMLVVGITLVVLGLLPRKSPAEPHCSACGYDLRGLTGAADHASSCPECDGDLSQTTCHDRRTRRLKLAAVGAALALTGSIPIAWAAPGSGHGHSWYHYGAFDLNSGRERQDQYVLGYRISRRESETQLSKLIAASGGSIGPSEWVHYRYSGSGLAVVRINFRYAKAHLALRGLMDFFDVVDAPEEDRAVVTRAALAAAKAEESIWLDCDVKEGWVRIMGEDSERVLVEWKAEPP